MVQICGYLNIKKLNKALTGSTVYYNDDMASKITGYSSLMAGNAENVSTSCRHHDPDVVWPIQSNFDIVRSFSISPTLRTLNILQLNLIKTNSPRSFCSLYCTKFLDMVHSSTLCMDCHNKSQHIWYIDICRWNGLANLCITICLFVPMGSRILAWINFNPNLDL